MTALIQEAKLHGYLKYSRMLVACGICLQKPSVHNWGVDNSFLWYVTSTVLGSSSCNLELRLHHYDVMVVTIGA